MAAVFGRLRMPSLGGATGWLNSEPLGSAELQGRVVLFNFWTLTCINWLRQEPYVRAWSQAYRDDGLIVIGVHTPEFSFEHELDRVRQATKERGIDYPVALDNHYWPALYFVDADGVIRDHHFGEGRYEQSERVIQRLLGVERELVSVEGLGVEAEADWDNLRTPETYLGSARSENRADARPEDLRLNHWALAGEWTNGREKVVLDEAGGSIAYRFQARDAHLVLSPSARDRIPRARRRGVRVHVRLGTQADERSATHGCRKLDGSRDDLRTLADGRNRLRPPPHGRGCRRRRRCRRQRTARDPGGAGRPRERAAGCHHG